MKEHRMSVLGMMSGSSLDGLDLAVCSFRYTLDPYQLLGWDLLEATTVPFPPTWAARLRTAPHLPGRELWRLHGDLGHWIGQTAASFLHKKGIDVNLIGSHGHTIFHDPAQGFTTQVGDGAAIAFRTGVPCVDQFRTSDLAAGGQGAPIAPLADQFLFPDHQAFLNLGGIANVSLKTDDQRIVAGDVSGANQVLDRLANLKGFPYDAGGKMARGGQYLPELAQRLTELPYHALPCPKSLGNAWVRDVLWPVVESFSASATDRMHTFCVFLAAEINRILINLCENGELSPQPVKVLVSGGGAHHTFLMDLLRNQQQHELFPLGYEVAPDNLADNKEAALIALCALHRYIGQPNAFATATGADRDTINGALYLPSPWKQESS